MTESFEEYRHRVFDFLWREVEPLVDGIERSHAVPFELFAQFRVHGLWGLVIPKDYGGRGLTTKQYLPFLAEMAKIGGVIRVILHVHNTAARAVVHYGTAAQKARYLPRLASGESSMSFAITEPDSGSGADVATFAERKGDHYLVNGTKHFITNADFADLHLVCCRTNEAGGRRGFTALVIPKDTPGLAVEPMPPIMGNNGPPHCILRFHDARVPADSLIGAEGDGLDVFLGELEPSRVFVAASSLGSAERALEIALDYAKRRTTFGKPIAARNGVRANLADMATDVYGLKLMLDDCANKLDHGAACALEASIVKLFGLDVVRRVTDKAMEVLGGRGYFQNYPYPFERLYREARINVLEEGTPTIQRLVIARALLDASVPLSIGTLGSVAHPHGVDPATGTLPRGGAGDPRPA
ncbi:MAG: acyl-CoA dehydrogenase family protein [Alphaproteobacteria bacterium]